MRSFLLVIVAIIALVLSGCTTMEDCCECLYQGEQLECSGTQKECVAECFDLCEPTRACYCSRALDVGCAAECGCE